MDAHQVVYFFLSVMIWFAGYFYTGKYVRPRWKIFGKFIFYTGISLILILAVGAYSLIFIIGHPLSGLIFHLRICRKHHINWRTCEPVEKYLFLQETWANKKH